MRALSSWNVHLWTRRWAQRWKHARRTIFTVDLQKYKQFRSWRRPCRQDTSTPTHKNEKLTLKLGDRIFAGLRFRSKQKRLFHASATSQLFTLGIYTTLPLCVWLRRSYSYVIRGPFPAQWIESTIVSENHKIKDSVNQEECKLLQTRNVYYNDDLLIPKQCGHSNISDSSPKHRQSNTLFQQ